MKINDYSKEFELSLSRDLIKVADLAADEFSKELLYAFCVLDVGGFEWVAASLNTREHLDKQFEEALELIESSKEIIAGEPKVIRSDELVFAGCELRCDEWLAPVYPSDGFFEDTNDILRQYNEQYENEDDEEYWSRGREIMLTAVAASITRLRSERPEFLDQARVLTGVQVPDALDSVFVKSTVEVSAKVNSPTWHAKNLRLLELYREHDLGQASR